MNAVDIKRDWEELTNNLYNVTSRIRNNDLLIFDNLEGKLLPSPDAIVLFDAQVCPIWKKITPRTMWKAQHIDGTTTSYPDTHKVIPINFNKQEQMSIHDLCIAGIELRPDKTLYESIQEFNNHVGEYSENRMDILYIIEE